VGEAGHQERVATRLLVLGACAAVFIACGAVHLLERGHYYVVNYDSFWFHMLAREISEGRMQMVVGSGLAYPLAGLSRVIGMEAACAALPLALGLATGLVLYLGVRRLYSDRRALLSVVCFTVALPVHFYFLAGNVDRDCLHLLIVTTGMLALALFWKERRWFWFAIVVGTVAALTLEWGWMAFVVYVPLLVAVSEAQRWDWRSWPPWAVMAVLAVIAWGAGRMAMRWLGWSGIAETQPINTLSILEYSTIVVPLGFGLWRSTREESNWPLAWFTLSLVAGCFALRLAEFGVLAACVLGGIGLEHIWDQRRIWMAAFAVGVLLFLGLSWKLPENMTMPPDWQHALEWVHDNTPGDAKVMAVGDYAHWIQDIAERQPVTEVGMDADKPILEAIYTAEDAGTVEDLLHANGCEYLVMSTRERNFPAAVGPEPWPFLEGAPRDSHLVYRNASVYVLAFPV